MEPVAGDTDRMETDRLLLRRFSGEDAEALLAFLGDPEVNEFLPMFPLRDAAEAERYLRYIGDWGPAGRTLRMYQLDLNGRENETYRKYWDRHPVHFVENP